MLQDSVDREIQEVGFLPGPTNGNGHSNTNGNRAQKTDHVDMWACTPKQKELILRIVEENKVDKAAVEQLFGFNPTRNGVDTNSQ